MGGSTYLSEIQAMNAGVVGNCGVFRRENVFCVDRFGRDISFYKPEDVVPAMQNLMEIFSSEYAAALDCGSLAIVLAKFYYSLIAIHPFSDGNRRTAFAFLEARARDKSYHLRKIELLQKLLFEGDVKGDMKKLTALFQYMLQST